MKMKNMLSPEQANQLFLEGAKALASAEIQGIRIDLGYVDKVKRILTKKIEKAEEEFRKTDFYLGWRKSTTNPINIHSPKQLSFYIYKVLKIKQIKDTNTGQGSTGDSALEELKIPALSVLIRARKLRKIRDTYIESFMREQVDGYIHPFFNLHSVITFRSSSDKPNFQNMPKHDKLAMKYVRSALFPRPGHRLVEVDFSGLEVSIAACYHQDPAMLSYLKDKGDFHLDVAKQIFFIKNFDKKLKEHAHLRFAAKSGFVFPQFYGDWYKSCTLGICNHVDLPVDIPWKRGCGVQLPDGTYLSTHLQNNNIKNFSAFENHIKNIEHDFWQKRFPIYNQWRERVWALYQKTGRVLSYTGFVYQGAMRRNEVINYPVQGAAFHCLLWCFIKLDKYRIAENWRSKLIGQIHDSIVLDIHPEEFDMVMARIYSICTKEILEIFKWIIVPLQVDTEVGQIDASWGDLEPYKF